MDADTTAATDFPVNVFTNDTNILHMLTHHMINSSADMYIYITNKKKGITVM